MGRVACTPFSAARATPEAGPPPPKFRLATRTEGLKTPAGGRRAVALADVNLRERALFQQGIEDVLQELCRQLKIVLEVRKGNLRFDHPKLRKMASSV